MARPRKITRMIAGNRGGMNERIFFHRSISAKTVSRAGTPYNAWLRGGLKEPVIETQGGRPLTTKK